MKDGLTKQWFSHIRVILGLAMWVAGVGCHSPSQYSSPRVVGRVVDEQTQQPIKGVQVRRVADARPPMEQPKGGEMLKETPPVLSGADGGFVVRSVRDLAFFRRLQWYSVSLSFTHPGYERLQTTYSLSTSTNTAAGEPVVQAGEILLKPLTK